VSKLFTESGIRNEIFLLAGDKCCMKAAINNALRAHAISILHSLIMIRLITTIVNEIRIGL
jgi:hypothetical protein